MGVTGLEGSAYKAEVSLPAPAFLCKRPRLGVRASANVRAAPDIVCPDPLLCQHRSRCQRLPLAEEGHPTGDGKRTIKRQSHFLAIRAEGREVRTKWAGQPLVGRNRE